MFSIMAVGWEKETRECKSDLKSHEYIHLWDENTAVFVKIDIILLSFSFVSPVYFGTV